MAFVEVGLVLTYTCVLLIKVCELSTTVCSAFGFGGTTDGLFLFFLLFGLSILLAQVLIGCAHFYVQPQRIKLPCVYLSVNVNPSNVSCGAR
jgi:hypothetical protein